MRKKIYLIWGRLMLWLIARPARAAEATSPEGVSLSLRIEDIQAATFAARYMRARLIRDLEATRSGAAACSSSGGEVMSENLTQAARDVLSERRRQIEKEGWSASHDDEHTAGQLAGAAACYARHVNARGWVIDTPFDTYATEDAPNGWPWDESWWKPTTPRRDLVKAAALILAEIERLDRAAQKPEAAAPKPKPEVE